MPTLTLATYCHVVLVSLFFTFTHSLVFSSFLLKKWSHLKKFKLIFKVEFIQQFHHQIILSLTGYRVRYKLPWLKKWYTPQSCLQNSTRTENSHGTLSCKPISKELTDTSGLTVQLYRKMEESITQCFNSHEWHKTHPASKIRVIKRCEYNFFFFFGVHIP